MLEACLSIAIACGHDVRKAINAAQFRGQRSSSSELPTAALCDWNENAAVFEQKDPLDTVLALDADDAVPNDEVVKEAETVAVEGEAVDFPEVDADGKDEATLRDFVAEEVLVPARGALPTGWRVDRIPQGPGRMRLVSTPPWSLRPPTCEPEFWLIIGKAAQREMRAKWQADDPDACAAQEERRSSWRRAERGGVVACGVVAGRGELGSSSVGDGHACLPRALAVRAIHDDPVSSDGGLLAQRARRRDACVETLEHQARALITSGTHGHMFLELCCASDSELAAAVVEHSVAIRVTSFEDLQLTSPRRSLHRLLRICKAYDVVVDIWVSIPCTAGTPFRRMNEKLGSETGDLATTYKLADAAVGLCRHAVRIGGGFSREWSNGNELWDLVVVRNLFERCGSSSCLVSTAAMGQHFIDRGGVFYVKKKWKIVTARPMLIEVIAPSVLGVSNLKMSSQASRKLSCAVMSIGGPLDRKTSDVPVPSHMQNILCYMCTIPNIVGYARVLCIFVPSFGLPSGAAATVYVEPVRGRQS